MLVISAKFGQLGNRLFVFANFIALAREHNFIVLNPAFDEYAHYFETTAKDFLCCYPKLTISIKGNEKLRQKYYDFTRRMSKSRWFNTITITRERPFSWKKFNLGQIQRRKLNFFDGYLFRDGWFVEDLELLRKYAEPIRYYFKPLKKYRDNVANLIENARRDTDILVGVHIRQGDYQNHQNGRYFFTTEEYLELMESVQKLFDGKRVKFLVCSNTHQDSNLFNRIDWIWGNNQIIEDMYAFAECDYIVGPYSTYSMWASFYGDKPYYMVREVNKSIQMKDFVRFHEWKGVFYYHEDWSKSVWEWTN
ncbi:MAG: alpha-1,2-fucosyltransferase [Phormidium sp.]